MEPRGNIEWDSLPSMSFITVAISNLKMLYLVEKIMGRNEMYIYYIVYFTFIYYSQWITTFLNMFLF